MRLRARGGRPAWRPRRRERRFAPRRPRAAGSSPGSSGRRPRPNWKFVSCASCLARCTSSAGRESFSFVGRLDLDRAVAHQLAGEVDEVLVAAGTRIVLGDRLAEAGGLLQLGVEVDRAAPSGSRGTWPAARSAPRGRAWCGCRRASAGRGSRLSLSHRSFRTSSVSIIFASPCRLK